MDVFNILVQDRQVWVPQKFLKKVNCGSLTSQQNKICTRDYKSLDPISSQVIMLVVLACRKMVIKYEKLF